MGGPIPLGYRLGEDGHLILGPEEEVELVRWIFQSYASGRLTTNGIARDLNRRGVPGPRGGRWSPRTVLSMLGSRNYLGCIVWGERRIGGYHRREKGFVVAREDKPAREQAQLLRGLKPLPVELAGDEDCVVVPDSHPAVIDRETFDACQRRREDNKKDRSAP